MEIETKSGKFVMRRPTAGDRNRAAISASEGDQVNQIKFLTELLPRCIVTHPFSAALPLKISLERMDFKEYDELMEALKDMLEPKKKD